MWASSVRWPGMTKKSGDDDRRETRDAQATLRRNAKREFFFLWPCDRVKMAKVRKEARGYRMGRFEFERENVLLRC